MCSGLTSASLPEIRISFDLPSFNYAFVWTGAEAEAAELLDDQLAIIARHGFDPAAVFRTIIVQAPAFLAGGDADSVQGAHDMLTAWVLRLQAEDDPDFSGWMIDYLPSHDFEVLITKAENGKMIGLIETHPRDDFTGAA